MGLITEDVRRFVEEGHMAYVGTASAKGIPNVVPKGTMGVLDEDHLVFADLYSFKTRRNLEANPYVAVTLVDEKKRTGYQLKGTAALVDRGEVFDRLNAAVKSRFPAISGAKYAVIIRVKKVFNISFGYDTAEDLERSVLLL